MLFRSSWQDFPPASSSVLAMGALFSDQALLHRAKSLWGPWHMATYSPMLPFLQHTLELPLPTACTCFKDSHKLLHRPLSSHEKMRHYAYPWVQRQLFVVRKLLCRVFTRLQERCFLVRDVAAGGKRRVPASLCLSLTLSWNCHPSPWWHSGLSSSFLLIANLT